jgi:hypothetical protein
VITKADVLTYSEVSPRDRHQANGDAMPAGTAQRVYASVGNASGRVAHTVGWGMRARDQFSIRQTEAAGGTLRIPARALRASRSRPD